ncbi:outer membrane lipoprotein carrier protein LolA [Spongiactinospora sp. 9N601]|uniref:outer membrane lipoprotein carrier protein LolA n=1 Tax=Spongiactinospora sp. 9N601 TaxID=3375149 RepID=UPI0037A6D74E
MPIAAVAVIAAAVGTGPVIAAVQGSPALPDRTAAQLLAEAARAARSGQFPPMSGTVLQTSSLGLPSMPAQSADPTSPLSLLTGAHEFKVWYGGADRQRVALLGRMSETNLIKNGDRLWLYESGGNKATRLKVADSLLRGEERARKHSLGGRGMPSDLTPQALSAQLLDAIDEHTAVGVSNDVKVADRAAYQLTFAPKSPDSLVKEIRIAFDGENYVPLRFQIYAKDSIEPAFEAGYTSVTFTPPAPENFTFTPPAGAKVTQETIGEKDVEQAEDHALGRLRHGDEKAGKDAKGSKEAKEAGPRVPGAGEVTVHGSAWTSVIVAPLRTSDLTEKPRDGAGSEVAGFGEAVLSAAKPVSGAWGNGRLIQTKLVTVLLTDDGRVLAGAVGPQALYEAAGRK